MHGTPRILAGSIVIRSNITGQATRLVRPTCGVLCLCVVRTPALAVLLGLNGLRVSEACATNIEDLGAERGHRTLQIIGTGNKPAAIPLVARTARTISFVAGERTAGPILLRADGQRLDSCTAYRWVRSIGRRAGLDRIHPHMLRAAFIMAALDAGVPLRDVQLAARHADPRTATIYDRRRENFDRHVAYAVVAYVTSG
ncbi:MAG: tyrosine-type recombinase/integrase [Ilumatobacteraceae bacterium]